MDLNKCKELLNKINSLPDDLRLANIDNVENIDHLELVYVKSAIYYNMGHYEKACKLYCELLDNDIFLPSLALSIIDKSHQEPHLLKDLFYIIYQFIYSYDNLQAREKETYKVICTNFVTSCLNRNSHEILTKEFMDWNKDILNPRLLVSYCFITGDYKNSYEIAKKNLDICIHCLNTMYSATKSAIILGKEKEFLEILKCANEHNHVEGMINMLNSHMSSVKRVDKDVNVMYCFNQDYAEGIYNSINSFVQNNDTERYSYKFYLFYDSSVSERVLDNLEYLCVCHKLIFEIVDIEKYLRGIEFKTDYEISSIFTLDQSAYYRIFAIDYIVKNGNTNDTLYIDSDTIVLNDMDSIFEIETDKSLLAVNENYNLEIVKLSMAHNRFDNYFNSGLMLFKPSHPKFLQLIKKTIDACMIKKNLFLQDQCALNIGFCNEYEQIDETYNYMFQNLSIMELDKIKLIHFIGPIKPWNKDYFSSNFMKNVWNLYKPKLLEVKKEYGIDTSDFGCIKGHRSGWKFVINSLEKLRSDDGLYVDDYVERSHCWHFKKNLLQSKIPYEKEWLGFMHNPPFPPDWFDYSQSPISLLSTSVFKKSLKNCKGIITLSKYHRDWLKDQIDVPVFSLYHPTEIPETVFVWEKFVENRKIIQLGYWLRKMHTIYDVEAEGYTKHWLIGQNYAKQMFQREEYDRDIFYSDNQKKRVNIVEGLNNDEYDNFLSSSIILLNLYDASANNAIIESIARNIPIIVNKIPSVVEYLGSDYPLYFTDESEIEQKTQDMNLLLQTHEYLKQMDKTFLSKDYFVDEFSKILIGLDNG
tara:strand:+ start:291 stop:2723 length:2433 start_codon:yes stop_codon:yes gene_type:complete